MACQNKESGVQGDLLTVQTRVKDEKYQAQEQIERYLLANHVVPSISSELVKDNSVLCNLFL